MERLSLFAQHAAIAIENARRYEQARQRAERLALMARIGTIITSALDLDDLLQRTADAIHELLGYPYISIALRQPPHGSELVLAGVAGIKETAATKHHRLRLGEGIVGTVAETGQAILSQDLASDPRYVPTPGTRDIRSELAVPIRLGENVLGVLNAESAGVLTAEDETSLGIIADQLAVAIENARLYVSMRTTLDETWLMYQTSHRISTAMDVDGVIQAYLEQMPQGSPCVCSVALYEVNEAGERTAVVVRGRWSPEEGLALCEERYPYSNDALDPLLDAGQTVTIRNVHADIRASAPLREAQSESRRPAVAMIPLLVRGDRIGLVVLSYPRVYDWPEEVLRPYQTTAAQLATAIDSRRQHLLVVERGHQIAALEERQRLARDLHDSVTQLLFSITLMAQSLAGAWRRDPAEGEHRVGRLLDLSRSALAEMRALLTEWRPATSPADGAPAPRPGILQLRGEDLPTALRRHIAHITSSGLDVRLDTEGYAPQPPILEEALFRITQEALNNVQKHAGASRAEVGLSVEGGEVVLKVRDNGRGFDSNAGRTASDKSQSVQSAQSGGMGLAGMRERAEALGGRVHMQTEVGAGTLVEARLPITEVAPPPAREVEAK